MQKVRRRLRIKRARARYSLLVSDGQASGRPRNLRKHVRGDRIVQLLFTQNMTQTQLAERVDMVRSVLSAKLHGKRRWYVDEVIAIADVLGTSVGYLLGETDAPTSR